VNDYEGFKGNGPCRIADAELQDAEYLCDTGFASARGLKDVLNVFGLGRSELRGK